MDGARKYMASPQEGESLSMILVMGVTGAGKSYFVNKLAGMEVTVEGASLNSCTHLCQSVPVRIGSDRVLLVDTPGFDDTNLSDTEVLTEISKLLVAQYELGAILKGIVYLHRITDVRYGGSAIKTREIFKKICGQHNFHNIILATTRWNEVDESLGAIREKELSNGFWRYMLDQGASMSRYYGDRQSGIGMISQLLGSQGIVLAIQKELVDEGKSLDQTSAGSFLSDNLDQLKQDHERYAAEINALRNQLDARDIEKQQSLRNDMAREKARARQAKMDQEKLRADIMSEVREKIDFTIARKSKKRKSLGLSRVLPFLPTAISALGYLYTFAIFHSLDGLAGPLAEVEEALRRWRIE